MKEFLKWLENNENIEKVIVWLLIITIGLIILNTTLMSLGLPHYRITTDNIVEFSTGNVADFIFNCVMSILNFYSIMLLIFRITEIKKMFKFAILYLILNTLIIENIGYIALQIFIFLYCIIFPYLYSKKNKKYLALGLLSLVFNTVVQSVWYLIKAQLVNYNQLNAITQSVLSCDYFIIMFIIILVKEIFLKKRGELDEPIRRTRMLAMDRRIQK